MNDRPTIRFFYNMGIEFFRNLQATYGMNQVLSMLESENGCADTSCIDYDSSGQLSNDFQQIAFESNEPEVPQTPHKERVLTLYISASFGISHFFFFLIFSFAFSSNTTKVIIKGQLAIKIVVRI